MEVPNHWITTHDPHGADDTWAIYLKEKTRSQGLPAVGDNVLFYETGKVGPDGTAGRKALVGSAVVIGTLRDRSQPKGKWLYEVPCSPMIEAKSLVMTQEMLQTIGERSPLHTWQGLKRITAEQHASLLRLMGI